MDTQTVLEHLAPAGAMSPKARSTSPRQKALIAELDRDGHDIQDARAILATMLETQQLHMEGPGRILRELSSA
jgi:hypothetical protein